MPTLPALHAQERMWWFERLQPGTPVYHLQRIYRLQGPLAAPALEAALRMVAARHEALRTGFREQAGRLEQVISGEVALDHRTIEPPAAGGDAAAVATACAEAEGARPFALDRPPLWRTCLVRIGPDDHVLVATMHHLISDAWSFNLWIEELAAACAARLAGRQPELPPAPQLREVAAWERSDAAERLLAAKRAHWQAALAGAPARLDLADDGPPAGDHRGGRVAVLVDGARLRALGAAGQATPFAALVALVAVLLSRLSRSHDLVLATPVARRPRPEWRRVFGPLLNTVPLRIAVAPETSFRELLRAARDATFAALAAADVPFERIVAEAAPERGGAHGPFDVLVNFLPPEPAHTAGELRITPMERPCLAARFPATVYAADRAGKLELRIDFQRGRFSAERMSLMLDALVGLLDQLAPASR